MILLSTTIYNPPQALPTTTNIPLEHLTHSLERRLVLSLLCSLLNTSLTPSKVNSGVTGQLPYNHLISKGADERRTLVRASMMTLLVALDYRRVDGGEVGMGEGKEENAFRYFVSKLVSQPEARGVYDVSNWKVASMNKEGQGKVQMATAHCRTEADF
jgi:hypothetical protein